VGKSRPREENAEMDHLINQAAGNEVSLGAEPGVATVANNENGDIFAAFQQVTELCQEKHYSKAVWVYTKVTKAIYNIEFKITTENAKSLGTPGHQNKVGGIGPQSADKILEFLQTGKIEMLRTGKIRLLKRKRRQLAKKLDRLKAARNEVALAAEPGIATVANNVEENEAGVKSRVGNSENIGIVAAFHELAVLYFKEGNANPGKAHIKATKAISSLAFTITTENAKSLGTPGHQNKVGDIGPQSADKMLEFLQTGKIKILEQKRKERNFPVYSKWEWVRGA
jgi:DNA polymerase/3'-5' exonuclease PolX